LNSDEYLPLVHGNDVDFDNNDNVDDTGEVNEDIMILMMI